MKIRSDSYALQTAAVAVGNGTAIPCNQYTSVTIYVSIATTATVTFEGTQDGTNWTTIQGTNLANGNTATAPTASGMFRIVVSGLQAFRARISAWTSGAVTVIGEATNGAAAASSGSSGSSGTQYAIGTAGGATDTGTVALSLRDDALSTLSDAEGDWVPERVDSTGSKWVTLSTAATVIGNIAHDTAISGAPVRIGARAETSLSSITPVADGDVTDLYAGVDGVLITRPHCNLEAIVSGVDTDTAGDSTSVIAAQGAGIKVYVTSVTVKNTHASTDAYIDIRDGAAGTVKITLPAPAAGGGHYTFPVPVPFTANTAVCVDPSAAVTTLITTVVGFKSLV